MKDNKSPGVMDFHNKILIETVEQISMQLERVFNLSSLKQGVVPLNGKKQT